MIWSVSMLSSRTKQGPLTILPEGSDACDATAARGRLVRDREALNTLVMPREAPRDRAHDAAWPWGWAVSLAVCWDLTEGGGERALLADVEVSG